MKIEMSDKSATLIVIVPVTEQTYIRIIDTVARRRYITAAEVLAHSAVNLYFSLINGRRDQGDGTIFHE